MKKPRTPNGFTLSPGRPGGACNIREWIFDACTSYRIIEQALESQPDKHLFVAGNSYSGVSLGKHETISEAAKRIRRRWENK
jgi:hypothetical protein